MGLRGVGAATIARVLELNLPDFEPLAFFPETTEAAFGNRPNRPRRWPVDHNRRLYVILS